MESVKERMDWCALFVEHRAQLQRAAYKVLGNIEWAQDVVQDTYLKLSEAAHVFEAAQPLAYLFQMVRNLAIDAHRRAALEARVFVGEEDGEQVPAAGGTPESVTVTRQDLRIVADALGTLPDRTRQAFELHRFNGLTQREIADRLGVSITLVNFMIRDALTHCAGALRRAER
ncbi:RNA polymerase sigma-70 factor (ECF subfamily) [Pseudoduganella flava]|uniref:RNA polymerase factor sigma-70 n=1 Tax=Pseudoduganella flava TaxID=871742 RepID=A0A562Q129_9BURK|nr:RNA polymerase factor sigma-70 [Pseudoduganella flava]QGZ38135.1 RNA polymerase factor sigma-70 [Pseudoduganella flava]TWI50348.1 RNA polymerase sigma-70 factor (ECF subfamily) [Pseudoduganella flava]